MKNNRFLYNLRAFSMTLMPKSLLRNQKTPILSKILLRKDRAEILERVNYYCRLSGFVPLDETAATLKDYRYEGKLTTYFFDAYEFTRYFADSMKWFYEKGDVNYLLRQPSITKSRPIAPAEENQNSVLLNIDKVRHFNFIKDPYSFEQKDDLLIFRGNCYQPHRRRFLDAYFNHPLCDLGQVGKTDDLKLASYSKPKIDVASHLRHKFILSLEGNDVASNLKWIMSSNSVAVMPKPKFETWFMEGKLEGGVHYVQIKDDYSDLEEKLRHYAAAPEECKEITANANRWVERFSDKEREKIISILTLEKYFWRTLQLSPPEELQKFL